MYLFLQKFQTTSIPVLAVPVVVPGSWLHTKPIYRTTAGSGRSRRKPVGDAPATATESGPAVSIAGRRLGGRPGTFRSGLLEGKIPPAPIRRARNLQLSVHSCGRIHSPGEGVRYRCAPAAMKQPESGGGRFSRRLRSSPDQRFPRNPGHVRPEIHVAI